MNELKLCEDGHTPKISKIYNVFYISCSDGFFLHHRTDCYESKQAAVDAC